MGYFKEALRMVKIYSLGVQLCNEKYGTVFKQAIWKTFASIFLTQKNQRIIVWRVLYLVVVTAGCTISGVSLGLIGGGNCL